MTANQLPIERIKLKELKPSPYNPRKITPKRKEALKTSIQQFGYAGIVTWNKRTGHIIGGHQGVEAMKELWGEDTEIEVRALNLTDAEEKALNIRLNKHDGEWDEDLLINTLLDIEANQDVMLKLTGLTDKEIDILLSKVPQPFEMGDEDALTLKDIKETEIQDGDIVEIDGKHRIFCGDPSKRESWEMALGHRTFDMILTAPECDSSIKLDNFEDNKVFHDHFKVMEGALQNAVQFMTKNRYLCMLLPGHGSIDLGAYHSVMLQKTGFKYKRTIYWVRPETNKNIRTPYPRWYNPKVKTESIKVYLGPEALEGGPENADVALIYSDQHIANKDKPVIAETEPIEAKQVMDYLTNVWRLTQGIDRGFPRELLEKLIHFYTTKNEVVMDPFSQGGRTMMAAQRAGRKSVSIEANPLYIELALRRYRQTFREVKMQCLNREVAFK